MFPQEDDLIIWDDDTKGMPGGQLPKSSEQVTLNPTAASFVYEPTLKPTAPKDSFADLTKLVKSKEPLRFPALKPEIPIVTGGMGISTTKTATRGLKLSGNDPQTVSSSVKISFPAKESSITPSIAGYSSHAGAAKPNQPEGIQNELDRLDALKRDMQLELSREAMEEKDTTDVSTLFLKRPDYDASRQRSGIRKTVNALQTEHGNPVSSLRGPSASAEKKVGSQHTSQQEIHQAFDGKKYDFAEQKYMLERTKSKVAEMANELRQKEVELFSKNQLIQALEAKLCDRDDILKKLKRYEADATHRDRNIVEGEKQEDSSAKVKMFEQMIVKKDCETEHLKGIVTRLQTQLEDWQKIQDKNKRLKEEIDHLKAQYEYELQDQREHVRDTADNNEDKIKTLKKQLREKTSSDDRNRNENKKLHRMLENNAKNQQKLESGKALRGAAHLVVPAKNERLPHDVFPCIDCLNSGAQCDDKNTCNECHKSDQHCARWRCSIRHITQECYETPCRFKHNFDGWLTRPEQPPQW